MKTFNLQSYLKKTAFYDDGRGYMLGLTRAFSNCYKEKVKTMSPQKAWDSCKEEFQKPMDSKNKWTTNHCSTDKCDARPETDAKTPAAKKIK